MTESKEKMMKIVVSENGPYVVSGQVPLNIQVITSNKDGFSWDWTEGKKFQNRQIRLQPVPLRAFQNHAVFATAPTRRLDSTEGRPRVEDLSRGNRKHSMVQH